MNKFQVEEPKPTGLLRVDPIVGELQENKIADLKQKKRFSSRAGFSFT